MMTQSVGSRTAGLFDGAALSLTSKDRTSDKSFEQLIGVQSSHNNSEGVSVSKRSAAQAKLNKDLDRQNKDRELTAKADDADEAAKAAKSEKLPASEQTVKAQQPEEKPTNAKDKTDKVSDTELMAQIAGTLQQVLDAVKSALKLSEEELNQLLASQGMTPEDLLLTQNLQQLILAESGQTSIMAVLTDETLANQMNGLLKTIEDIKAASGLTLSPEQLQELLDRIKALEDSGAEQVLLAQEGSDSKGQVTELSSEQAIATEKEENKASGNVGDQSGQNDQSVTLTAQEENISTNAASLTDARSEADRQEQQAAKASEQFEAFLNNLTAHSNVNLQTEANGDLVRITELRNIANQIIEHIKVKVQPDQSSMELQLNPEHLGRVNLTVASKSGIMTAQFVVENELAKEAIESQLHILRDALNEQGMKVEEIEVTVMANAFPQYNQEEAQQEQETSQNNNRGKISLEEALDMSEGNEEAATEVLERTDAVGTLIDYTA